MPRIDLREITKEFDGHVAIDHINLEVKDGEYMVILGPTGAGKTTLLRILSGLLSPDEGQVLIDGKDITRKPPEERGITYMSQTYSLFPHLPVWDNVKFSPTVRGLPEPDADTLAREMLLLVGLLDRRDAYPKELSGGMQQRTALARALTAGTDVLLLDEPLRALDARLRIALRLSIRRLCKDLRMTALHVTHDQEEALLVADTVAILRHGKIVQLGPSRQVYEEPANPFVAQFLGEANFFAGRIERVLPDKTLLRSNGRVWEARASRLRPGQVACLALKSENVKVQESQPGTTNAFGALVRRRFFLGRFVGLELSSEVSDFPIKAKLRLPDAEGISEGDHVSVSFQPEKAIMFPIPPSGLAKELEVE